MNDNTITDKAEQRIVDFLAPNWKDGDDKVVVKVFRKETGCAGFTYVIEPVGTDDDIEGFSIGGTSRLTILKSDDIGELRIGFDDSNKLDQHFTFREPEARQVCGCGKSFKY